MWQYRGMYSINSSLNLVKKFYFYIVTLQVRTEILLNVTLGKGPDIKSQRGEKIDC